MPDAQGSTVGVGVHGPAIEKDIGTGDRAVHDEVVASLEALTAHHQVQLAGQGEGVVPGTADLGDGLEAGAVLDRDMGSLAADLDGRVAVVDGDDVPHPGVVGGVELDETPGVLLFAGAGSVAGLLGSGVFDLSPIASSLARARAAVNPVPLVFARPRLQTVVRSR